MHETDNDFPTLHLEKSNHKPATIYKHTYCHWCDAFCFHVFVTLVVFPLISVALQKSVVVICKVLEVAGKVDSVVQGPGFHIVRMACPMYILFSFYNRMQQIPLQR